MTKKIMSENSISGNDKIIQAAIATYNKLYWQVPGTSTGATASALLDQADAAASILTDTQAGTVSGLKAKVAWLRLDENYNDGEFDPDFLNGKVLISLFEDIEKTDQ